MSKSTTPIIGWIATLLGWLMNGIYNVLSAIGIENIGLAIIFFTIIVYVAMTPLQIRQQKMSKVMNLIQPELNKLQKKYEGKRDQASQMKMNEEMQDLYARYGVSPTGSCLPLLIQMPIFFALFSVLRYHVPEDASFYNILPSLPLSASTVFTEQGFVASIPYIIFVLLFGILTFLPMILQNNQQQNSMTKVMTVVMTIMMLFVGWTSPAGVVLFWVTSSAWAVIQQQLILGKRNREYQKEEEAEETVKPVQVDVVRREKKPRPKKKH